MSFKFVQSSTCSQKTETSPGYLLPTWSQGLFEFFVANIQMIKQTRNLSITIGGAGVPGATHAPKTPYPWNKKR